VLCFVDDVVPLIKKGKGKLKYDTDDCSAFMID